MNYLKWLLAILRKIKPTITKTKDFVLDLLEFSLHKLYILFVVSIVSAPLMILIIKSSELHTKFIRGWVGSRVFMVTKSNGAGGTGFAVTTPSGHVRILTNDHICADAAKEGKLYLSGRAHYNYQVKILARSSKTDLCLLEAPNYIPGLDLAKEYFIGDQVRVVGHPDLMPLTVSPPGDIIYITSTNLSGEYKGIYQVDNNEMGGCDLSDSKYRVYTKNKKKFCSIFVPNIIQTNIITRKGNSGSPLVNFQGDVVGVVAGIDKLNWGLAVTLEDVVEFLQDK